MHSLTIPMGGINMRGKKTQALRCGCCTAQDLRGKEIDVICRKEIQQAIEDRELETRLLVNHGLHDD